MPVDAKHPAYVAMAPDWAACRDAIAGQRTVHEKGVKYLPVLAEQKPPEYDAYRARALFFNATQRTAEGLGGMIFRKPPQVDEREGMTDLLDDFTMTGIPLDAYAESVTQELLATGRFGLLVDYPRLETLPATVAQAEASGARAFCTGYPAESIIDWRAERINNRQMLTHVRLRESASKKLDEFTSEAVPQIRVLDLVREGDAYVYEVTLWQQPDPKSPAWQQVGPKVRPLRNGATIARIPFVFVGLRDTTPELDKPPLLDLAETNFDHYRLMADYRHGLHFAGLPTAVVTGHNVQSDANGPAEVFYIGSATAWVFPQHEADAKFLEFTGSGLEPLSKAIKEDEERMAALGARMLAPEKRMAEAAETAAIHRAGEASVLAAMANSVARAITEALRMMAEWNGRTWAGKVTLNTDYFPIAMSPEQIKALMALWQMGGISKPTLFENLKYGEIIAPEKTFEEEEADIANNPPMPTEPDAPAPGGGE